jgi:lipid-binding SYLF domain-containing protein
MPMPSFSINNPLPSSMRSKCCLGPLRPSLKHDVADSLTGECRKAGKILASFVDPRQAFGPDKIIPPQILANAKVCFGLSRTLPEL